VGRRELIESLRRDAGESARKVWHDAREEAGRLNEEAEARIEALAGHYGVLRSRAVREKTEGIVSEAKGEARQIRFSAQAALSGRLLAIALSSLRLLRDSDYENVFGTLASELPPCDWRTVKVHPDDRGLAKRHFPDAEVRAGEGISGGMEVASEGGRLRVINTLEKRLERAWPEIISSLLRDVYDGVARGPSRP
jgi:V/A-type H+-transporting ATPase subunit E